MLWNMPPGTQRPLPRMECKPDFGDQGNRRHHLKNSITNTVLLFDTVTLLEVSHYFLNENPLKLICFETFATSSEIPGTYAALL